MGRITILFFILSLFAALSVTGQALGVISGSVLDQDQSPTEGAHVFLVQTSYGATSDLEGKFLLKNIPAGEYILAVSKIGFQEQQFVITVAADETTTLDISLTPATYHLDEIAVYGQKRETIHAIRLNAPLEQTPLSVNIVSQELLTQQQAISLEDALRNVSGLSKFGSYGISDNINIRGFDIGLAGGPENYRINGVMLRTPYSNYVEEVQVLKGPASILYGDVEPGGIINFVTKKPKGYDHASLELKVGEYGLFRPSIDVGGKLSDNLSYRLNTVYETSNSFRDEVYNEQFMVAPSLLWNIGSQTSLNVDALFMQNEATIDWGFPVGLSIERAQELDHSNFYGYPDGTSEGNNNMIMTTFVHRFSKGWQIRNVTSFSNQNRLLHDVYPIYDAATDSVAYSFGDYSEKSRTNTFSNFLDITGDVYTGSVRHRLLAGFDFSDISRPVVGNFVFPIPGMLSLDNPVWENTALSSAPILDDDVSPFTRRIGFNIQDLVSLFDDRLNLLIGGRFSQFTDGTRYSGDAEEPADYSETSESRFTPRVGLTFELIDKLTVYGSYAESFSSVTPQPGRGLLDPEPLLGDQIEFGIKQSLLNDRLGITLAYFDLNRKNVLQFDIINPNGSISDPNNFRANQSGEHSSQGVELDINGKLFDNWQFFGAFSYFQTEVIKEIIQNGDSEPIDFAGKELPNNPNTKLSLWTQYTFKEAIPGLSLGGGVFYQSDMFGDRMNTDENIIEAFTRFDLMLGYQYKYLKFQLNVQNLGNTETFQRSIFGSFVPQYPRRIVASIAFEL